MNGHTPGGDSGVPVATTSVAATVLQTVAMGETVDADGFHREPTGSAAHWSLGRHATLEGWTPAIPSHTAPPSHLHRTAAPAGGQPARCLPLLPLFAAPTASGWTPDIARVARPLSACWGRGFAPATQPERGRSYSR